MCDETLLPKFAKSHQMLPDVANSETFSTKSDKDHEPKGENEDRAPSVNPLDLGGDSRSKVRHSWSQEVSDV